MAISPYIRKLREKIGHEMLHVPAVSGIIIDKDGRLLLHRSSDDGNWYTIGGAIEPGEHPADAVVREVREETGLDVVPLRIVAVQSSPLITYPNADQIHYVGIAFLCRVVGGTLHVADDESLELRYFAPDQFPELPPDQLRLLHYALAGRETAFFEPPVATRHDRLH
jgi:8-oxo-dGTP pyrophosphatase MutT (NUDIX family)